MRDQESKHTHAVDCATTSSNLRLLNGRLAVVQSLNGRTLEVVPPNACVVGEAERSVGVQDGKLILAVEDNAGFDDEDLDWEYINIKSYDL